MNAALVISPRDNVATALESLDVGRALAAGGGTIVVAEPIPRGHKLARRPIRAGEAVVKYGSPIGTATAAHIHRGAAGVAGPVAVMLTFIPALLALLGDRIDWPRRRKYDAAAVALQRQRDLVRGDAQELVGQLGMGR